jgi:hypothetical protein
MKKVVRKPSNVYQLCPSCHSKDLIRLEVDVLCGECDWMSCGEYVESGGMDNVFEAFRDHFSISPEDEIAAIVAKTEAEFLGLNDALSGEPMEVDEFFDRAEASA